MPTAFKKCDICKGKMPVQDPHSTCLLCLGPNHDPKACALCRSLSSQARKNRESRLTSAIALGKLQERGSRASSLPPLAPPALSSRASVCSVGSGRAAVPSVVCVPAGTPSTTSDMARGSKPPSATDKPSKRPHKPSGTEGTERASRPKEGPEGSRSKEATEPEVHLASPSSSKASKGSRHAMPRERTEPAQGSRSPRPSSSTAAAVLLDLPDNPFFPSEETPRHGKKRHHDKADRDPAPKKAKPSKDRADPPRAKDKERSPSKQARASVPSAPCNQEPTPGDEGTPVTPLPPPTMDFIHGADDTAPPRSPEHRSPSQPATDEEEDASRGQEIPDLFFDMQLRRYYMSVPEDRALREFTKLNPHPADRANPTTSVPTVSVYERSPSPRRETSPSPSRGRGRSPSSPRRRDRLPSPPRRRSRSSVDLARPRSRVRVTDPLSSDLDSEDELLPPSEAPSDEDVLSGSASPQRMHNP
ncbi:serine/arginine repetitive matrix protein 1-like, partial [Sceloporus undulatus]|uniref:serine/arginine repetitive matrix protein 1-like n=1 Tax=Sceloporus undulatus TaxID=8520 RepID=UPI001C4BC259